MNSSIATPPIRFDSHIHTPLCGHAIGKPMEYVKTAVKNQIGLMTFTCHIPMESELFCHEGIRMHLDQLDQYVELIAQTREQAKAYGIEVLTGIEAEYHPDEEHMLKMDKTLAAYPFDFVLGSLHHMLPSYQIWLEENNCTTNETIVPAYFQHLSLAAKSGRYHSLSHPDVIRLYGTLPEPFNPLSHQKEIETFLDTVAQTSVCLEINTSGLTKGDYQVHPDPIIMEWAIERGIPFTIGSDSHRPQSIGQFFDEIYAVLIKKGLKDLHYFKEGKRYAVEISDLIKMRPTR